MWYSVVLKLFSYWIFVHFCTKTATPKSQIGQLFSAETMMISKTAKTPWTSHPLTPIPSPKTMTRTTWTCLPPEEGTDSPTAMAIGMRTSQRWRWIAGWAEVCGGRGAWEVYGFSLSLIFVLNLSPPKLLKSLDQLVDCLNVSSGYDIVKPTTDPAIYALLVGTNEGVSLSQCFGNSISAVSSSSISLSTQPTILSLVETAWATPPIVTTPDIMATVYAAVASTAANE